MVVRELIAKLGLNVDETSFGVAHAAFKGLQKGMLVFGGMVAGVGVALGAAVASTAKTASELSDLSARTGQTTQTLQELEYAGKQVGVSMGEIVQGLTLMSRTAQDAATGGKEASYAFSQIGINPKNFKTSDALFGAVADKIKGLKDSGQDMKATAVAMDVFGRSGAALIPLLSKGSAGIEEMRSRARLLGFVMSDEMVKAGDDLDDKFADLLYVLQGLKQQIAAALLPAVSQLVTGFIDWYIANKDLIGQRLDEMVTAVGFAFKVAYALAWPFLKVIGFMAMHTHGAILALGLLAGMLTGALLFALKGAAVQAAISAGSLSSLQWGAAAAISSLRSLVIVIWQRLSWAFVSLVVQTRAAALSLMSTGRSALWTGWTFKGLASSIWTAIRGMGVWLITSLRAAPGAVLTGLRTMAGLFSLVRLQAVWAGIAAAAAWVASLWPLWLLIAVVAVLIAIVEDLWTAFTGGQSVFGTLADLMIEAFGAGIDWVKAKFLELWDWIGFKAEETWMKVKDFFSFGGEVSAAGDFSSTFGGGAGVGATLGNSPSTGKNVLASNQFDSHIVINPPPGTSSAAIASDAVGKQSDFMSSMLQETFAAG